MQDTKSDRESVKSHALLQQQLILGTVRMSFTFVGFGTGATVLRDGCHIQCTAPQLGITDF
jgi:hypothetical protein